MLAWVRATSRPLSRGTWQRPSLLSPGNQLRQRGATRPLALGWEEEGDGECRREKGRGPPPSSPVPEAGQCPWATPALPGALLPQTPLHAWQAACCPSGLVRSRAHRTAEPAPAPHCFSPSLRVVPVASLAPGLPPPGASSELRLPRTEPRPLPHSLSLTLGEVFPCLSPHPPSVPGFATCSHPVCMEEPSAVPPPRSVSRRPRTLSLPAWLPSGFVVHHLMSQSHRSRTCSLGGPAWMAGVRGTF